MTRFYISRLKNVNNDFEIHTENCLYLPVAEYRVFVGEFSGEEQALEAAKKLFKNSNFCYWCAKETHESKHPFQLPENKVQ